MITREGVRLAKCCYRTKYESAPDPVAYRSDAWVQYVKHFVHVMPYYGSVTIIVESAADNPAPFVPTTSSSIVAALAVLK